jgi:thymidylate synthase (FAD)
MSESITIETTNQTTRTTSDAAEEILGGYFPVLDHGFVSLIDYMGNDQAVERAARVSYGAGTRKKTKTRGLIRYLRRHRHTTPSEMVEFKFHCGMPLFVARQWVRHRTANLNEYSGRYSLMPLLYYTPDKHHFSPQSKTNRQGRDDETVSDRMYENAVQAWHEARERTSEIYEALAAADVARELSRIDLPLSTYTYWIWKIDLHNLMRFLSLRCDEHAQWEIRQYANVMAGMVKRVAPLSFEAWMDYEFRGCHMSLQEREVLFRLLTPKEDEVRGHCRSVTDSDMKDRHNMSNREVQELKEKLEVGTAPNFDLDLGDMKNPEYFEEKMQEAVPEVSK